jgi:arylsulfatase A-like enzyme
LQRFLDAQGYETGLAGKYLNLWDVEKDPAYFDHWALFEDDYRHIYYDFTVNVDGVVRTIRNRYSTNYVRDVALDFIESTESDDSRPWFLYVTPYAPHMPVIVEPKYEDAPVARYEGNPGVFEQDRSDKPSFVRDRRRALGRARMVRRLQLRALRSVDDLVDRVMRKVRRLGEEQDTLAVFMSDNGYIWAEHNLRSKRWPYLPSVRIPMFVRWPGHLPPGRVDKRIVANVDVTPTVLDALGVWPNDAYPTDGRSLLDRTERRRLLLENWFYKKGPPDWAATLGDDYNYIEYYEDGGETPTFREYYDLDKDPWQLHNLLGDDDPGNDPDGAMLGADLKRDRRCAGDSCP